MDLLAHGMSNSFEKLKLICVCVCVCMHERICEFVCTDVYYCV